MIKRVLILVAALAAIATSVYFSPSISLTAGDATKPLSLSVAAADLKLVCPGAAVVSGGNNGTSVGTFARAGAAAVAGSAGGQSTSIRSLGATGSTSQGAPSFSAKSPALITLTTAAQGSTALNAGQLQLVANSRLNGLMGASCQAPATDIWLVGGDTSTGRETLLLLANPSQADATVGVTVIGLGGASASSSGISVAAGGNQIVALSSVLPETKSIAVHITSHGSAVGAWLQQRTLRGLSYAGADFVSPSPAFAKSLQVPGILVRGDHDATALLAANADYFDLLPTLRVFNPNSKSITFVAQIFGADAKSFGTVVRDTVPANSVSDFAITGLQDGDYSAFITADAAITASVRLARTNKAHTPATDFTWLPAAQQVSGMNSITIPTAGISKLSITNGSNVVASVNVDGQVISLNASSTKVVQVTAGKTIKVDSGSTAIGASLVVDVSGSVANLALVSYANVGNQVAVLVR